MKMRSGEGRVSSCVPGRDVATSSAVCRGGLTKHIMPVIHFVMQRKQLLEIARRAEGLAANMVETGHASTGHSA